MNGHDKSNVKSINTSYARQVMRNEQAHAARRAKLIQIRKKRFYIIIGVFGLIMIPLLISLVQSNISLHQTNTQIVKKQRELDKAKSDNKALNDKAKLLKDDDYLQKVIRSRYYYSKNGETIFTLPSDSAKDVTAK